MSLEKIERFIASAKFAFIIILIFAGFMAVGTFFESYYGTEYAGRAIYKSWPFMIIQGVMLLSVFYALLLRLPPRKYLYGFYTIHAGLILLFCGSFITYYAGIDGQLTLSPGNPSRTVALSRDMLYITQHGQKEVSYLLPYTSRAITLDESWNGITLKRYYPFSEDRLDWPPIEGTYKGQNFASSKYLLANENMGQEIILSHYPDVEDFPPQAQLGPLRVHYLPKALRHCFAKAGQYLLYNPDQGTCITSKEQGLKVGKTTSNKKFLILKENGKNYSFFPHVSPFAFVLNAQNKLELASNFPWQILAKENFAKGPQLLLFGNALAYFEDEKWQVASLIKNRPQQLPWMGFQISLLRHEEQKFPQKTPYYTRPIQAENKLIKGDQRALELVIDGRSHWVSSGSPLDLQIEGQKYSFVLGQQTLQLPFEINLTKFKMEKDPGTNNPASYESFVNTFSPKGVSKHHIFMNNPLKFGHFTFYQASYFPLENGRFGSVLSVNFDPGRWWKYLGSLFLVLGAIWHFYLRRKRPFPSTIKKRALS